LVDNGAEILKTPDDSEIGCVLEVDLEYPSELHSSHNDFPLCPERIIVDEKSRVPKLVATLHHKRHYKAHYCYVKRALEQGLRITAIHRGIRFSQSPWLKSYIEMNTKARQEAADDFSKELFKLINNATFGKTCENVRGRRDFRAVAGQALALKYIARPEFKHRSILNSVSDFFLIEMQKTSIKFDKPLQSGAAILDISKCLMTDFHYKVMKPMIEKLEVAGLKLMYGDTDSLVYEITLPKDTDLYTDVLSKHREHFDFSSYPRDHSLYSIENKKVIGKFSDETNGDFLTHFVALRPKCYAMKTFSLRHQKETLMKKAKGVKKSVIKSSITFDDYVNVLRTGDLKYAVQHNFQSRQMNIATTCQKKIALSRNDDKRYICEDNVSTLAWGHTMLEGVVENKIIEDKNFQKKLEIKKIELMEEDGEEV
jgi:hypothetical protein